MAQAQAAVGLRTEVGSLRKQLTKMEELQAELSHLDGLRKEIFLLAGIPDTSRAEEVLAEHAEHTVNMQVNAQASRFEDPVGQPLVGRIPKPYDALVELPVNGPISRGFAETSGRGDPHEGVDIAGSIGSKIVAAGSGTVLRAGEDKVFGLIVVLGHGNGLSTVYGHNSKIVVSVGDWVEAGQTISEMGSTGLSSAPHLHFEVRQDGKALDPGEILARFSGGNGLSDG
jgi:murein DD-endopeptidase MepM/ murein hydrolase activator NlpD